jgi:hypothetical protein
VKDERTFDVETEQHREHLSKFVLRRPLPFQALLGPLRKKRSTTANARLWLLHTMAGNHLGYSPEEMHEHALCHHYGYTEHELMDPLTGEIVTKRVPNERSSNKNTKEFAEFMFQTETWYGEEFGCWLPAQEIVDVENH